ncbi:MAG: heavy metal-associated domain protein [Butyricicoccus porcorum]|nr:heavy metal-associated domain protein [Butyricicoccus porcorum]
MSKNSAYFSVSSLNGMHDLKRIRQEIDRTCDGVLSVAVGLDRNVVTIDFDDTGVTPQKLRHCLTNMGMHVTGARIEYHSMQ